MFPRPRLQSVSLVRREHSSRMLEEPWSLKILPGDMLPLLEMTMCFSNVGQPHSDPLENSAKWHLI